MKRLGGKNVIFAIKKRENQKVLSLCTPAGARTLDTLIKSQVLYQLSYKRITMLCFANRSFVQTFLSTPLLRTPAGARTLDTLIKSQVLYQLSYKRVVCCFAGAKVVHFFYSYKLFKDFISRMNEKNLFGVTDCSEMSMNGADFHIVL